MSQHSRWDLTTPTRDESLVTAGYRAERLAEAFGTDLVVAFAPQAA
jgi:hypothetical protein